MKAMGKVTLTLGLMIIVSLFLTSCNGVVTPEIDMGNSGNQSSNNPSSNNPNSNNYQNSSTDPVEETVIVATEEPATNPNSNNYQNSSTDPVVESVTEEPGTVEADTTKPVITGSRAPLPNSFGWNNSNVTVSFSCADTGPVQSGIDKNTVAGETVTTEGKDQSVTNTGVCIDVAGNTADPVTVSNINIDKTSPEVTITLPGTGEYVLNQSITATWSATDALSGVVSPVSGTVSIDTSSLGTKTFTLPEGTAMDKAGNSSLEVTISYSVIEDTGDPDTVYPQKWATGTGTVGDPWANNCIQKAYDAVPTGGTIFLKAGYYQLAGQLDINKQINIVGEGINKTIIKTANARGFQVDADYTSIKNLTVDGDAQADNNGGMICINSSQASHLLYENIEVKNAGYYGMNFNDPNYCMVLNIQAHDNYRHGVHMGANMANSNQHNTYQNIDAWNNGREGFDDRGSYDSSFNTYDNIRAWDNGNIGICIGQVDFGILTNSMSWGSGGEVGINIWCNDFLMDNVIAYDNNLHGICVTTGSNISLSNVISKNNNTSGGANGSGLLVDNVSGTTTVHLSQCQFYDDKETLLQAYGIYVENVDIATYIEIVNCEFTPNAIGDIYNPTGAVVTVITDKMLAKL